MLALIVGLSGCATPSALTIEKPCPEGWAAAVLWSSETAGRSEVAFVGESGVVEQRSWPFQGLGAAPNALTRSGADVWMVANGNTIRDRTDVLRFTTASCALRSWRVPEQAVWSVAETQGGFVTTDALNGAAHLHRRDREGRLVAENVVEGISLTTLVAADDQLLALGNYWGGTDEGLLLELDPVSLAVKRRIDLSPLMSTGPQAVSVGGVLYFPITTATGEDGGEHEGRTLVAVSLRDLSAKRVPLDSPAPYLMAGTGDSLFVGHTFINPGFREMSEYRFVSRYDLRTGGVETFEVGGPLRSIAVAGSSLAVLTGDSDAVMVKTYDAASMKLISSLEVPRPSGSGYFYPAGLIVR